MLAQFEQHIEDDSPLAEVLPSVYNKYPVRYRDHTAPVVSGDAICMSVSTSKTYKSDVPPAEFPSVVMNPVDAHSAYIRGEVELVRIRLMPKGELRQKGRCLIHGVCFAWYPGKSGVAVQRYFLALEEGVNLLPDFRRSCKVFIAKPMRMA